MATVAVTIDDLHPGQRAIYGHPARYKVLRCGRRFGKTQLAVYVVVMCMSSGGHAGWFAPQTQYADEAWDRLERVLRPLIVTSDKQKREIVLNTGGTLHMYTTHNNEDPGRGRAFDVAVFDEAGLCPTLDSIYDKSIRATLLDRRGVLYVLGTSKVSGIGFRRLFQRAQSDDRWHAFRAKTEDNPFLDQETIDELERDRKYMSPTAFAAEYEGGDDDGGASFFPVDFIERLAAEAQDPQFRCSIDVPMPYGYDRDHWIAAGKRDLSKVVVRSDVAGAWRLWMTLAPDRQGRMRPPQTCAYAMGVDPGNGVGANPAIISVGDADTGRKVAVFRSTRVTPPELARIAAIAGIWFGGRLGQAAVLYEANGPGESFGQAAVQLAYCGLLRRSVFGAKTHEQELDAYGWWSTPGAKEQLFIEYRQGLTGGEFFNPSREGLLECAHYRYDEHGRLVADQQADKTHGDEAVADALLCRAMKAIPRVAAPEIVPPIGSEAFEEWVEERRARTSGSGW